MFLITNPNNGFNSIAKLVKQTDISTIVVPLKKEEFIDGFKDVRKRVIFVQTNLLPITQNIINKISDAKMEIVTTEQAIKNKISSTQEIIETDISRDLMLLSMPLMNKGLRNALQVATTALISELISTKDTIISVGGEEENLDTAAIIKPGFARDYSDSKIEKIICSPNYQ